MLFRALRAGSVAVPRLCIQLHCFPLSAHKQLAPQVAKDYDRAREAFEKAATGHSRQGSPWQSGKSFEKAAGLSLHPWVLHHALSASL